MIYDIGTIVSAKYKYNVAVHSITTYKYYLQTIKKIESKLERTQGCRFVYSMFSRLSTLFYFSSW